MSDSDNAFTMPPIRNIAKIRNYLIKSGVLEAVLRVIGELHAEPELPDEPIEYIRNNISAPDADNLAQVKKKLEEANEKIIVLEKQNTKLKTDKDCTIERNED